MLWSDALYAMHDVPENFRPSLEATIALIDEDPARAAFRNAVKCGNDFLMKYPIRSRSGKLRWFQSTACVFAESGKASWIFGTLQDVTELQNLQSAGLFPTDHQPASAASDVKTLDRMLERARTIAQSTDCELALVCLRIDEMTRPDQSLRRSQFEEAIEGLMDRFRGKADEFGSVKRLTGDSIAVIFEQVECRELLARQIESLQNEAQAHFSALGSGLPVQVTATVMFERCEQESSRKTFDGADLGPMVDETVNQSENRDKSRIAGDRELRRLNVISAVRDAKATDEFVVAYQPKINLRESCIAGFEALIRWQHPVKGLLGPATFYQALEDRDLEHALSDMILQKVVAQLAVWRDADVDVQSIAVNLAYGQLQDVEFFNRIVNMTQEHSLSPSQLKLEIRESVLLGTPGEALSKTLNCMHDAGFSTAVDDFGSGYARWSDISGFTVDRLKIDQSLITNVFEDQQKKSLVKSIINLAHDLDLEVIAEGVETASVDRILKAWGCDFGQGFAYARPMLADAIPGFIDDWNAHRRCSRNMHLIVDQTPCEGVGLIAANH